jgi:hypothetical protein
MRAGVCSFFNDKMGAMPAMVDNFKTKYCFADKSACARNMVFDKLLQGYAPGDDEMMSRIEKELKHLYPNDFPKAETIIGWLVKY